MNLFARSANEASPELKAVSGIGSTLAQTEHIRAVLPRLFRELGVRTLLDAPCGDCHWMRHVEFDREMRYVGVDIATGLIEVNQRHLATDRATFSVLDIRTGTIPAVDLILCRDCLVHLSDADVGRALAKMCRSGSQWLLTTTFPGRRENRDISTGGWRPLNLEVAPFGLPSPTTLIVERCTVEQGRYADKSLGLWRLRDLDNAPKFTGGMNSGRPSS